MRRIRDKVPWKWLLRESDQHNPTLAFSSQVGGSEGSGHPRENVVREFSRDRREESKINVKLLAVLQATKAREKKKKGKQWRTDD